MRISAFSVQEVDESIDRSDEVRSELRIFWESAVQFVNAEAHVARGEDPDEAVGLGLRSRKKTRLVRTGFKQWMMTKHYSRPKEYSTQMIKGDVFALSM